MTPSGHHRVRAKRLRLALVGWGAIARRVAGLLVERDLPVDVVGVAVRDAGRSRELPSSGSRLIADPGELGGLLPDLVVEAAGRGAVSVWGPTALRTSPAFAVASTSAFTDENLLSKLAATAERHGSRLLIPPGALGGIDALAGAAVAGLDAVCHSIIKPPLAWRGTEAEALVDLEAVGEATVIFSGSAREAAARYPQNANATVITALAGLGLDRTRVTLVADPSAKRNRHRIEASGTFGCMAVELDNNPLPTNPKSSDLAALGLVRLIANAAGTVVV